ncbi:hypothetical protein [Larsenimonas rhizosphaerae]|uniref:Uncharacterized protein n=1 Tax=Larsenimonas rhizosphaerae TaxID=2944682 RepID=A0AA41ZKY8_9GAMM|nr:hypothetical protein [Larsenimonas rhizosphaerae]MCX2523693.1 hypothetical protein [Larsenimonas rhizosphaerae]
MRIIGCTLIGLALAGLALFYAETGSFRQSNRYIGGVTLALPWRLAVPADTVSSDELMRLETRLIAAPPLLAIMPEQGLDQPVEIPALALMDAFEHELAARGITHYQLEVSGWLVTRSMLYPGPGERSVRRCLVSVDAPITPPLAYPSRQMPLMLTSCQRLSSTSAD